MSKLDISCKTINFCTFICALLTNQTLREQKQQL